MGTFDPILDGQPKREEAYSPEFLCKLDSLRKIDPTWTPYRLSNGMSYQEAARIHWERTLQQAEARREQNQMFRYDDVVDLFTPCAQPVFFLGISQSDHCQY